MGPDFQEPIRTGGGSNPPVAVLASSVGAGCRQGTFLMSCTSGERLDHPRGPARGSEVVHELLPA